MSDSKTCSLISVMPNLLGTQIRRAIARLTFVVFGLFCLGAVSAMGQEPEIVQGLKAAGAEIQVYKSAANSDGEKVDLNMYIFKPEGHKAADKRPAVVFFFGGGWKAGKPSQFQEHCKYLAGRGIVAMTADYRVSSRHGTKAVACVADAKSAVRWIRNNAKTMGIDPSRIAAGGGSAGGHVAACTGVIKTNDEPNEDSEISSVPNAMILFNPALVLGNVEGKPELDEVKMKGMKDRVGAEPISISPYHQIAAGAPPAIVFHGKADTTVPYWTAEVFATKMKEAGNRCDLIGYEDQGHGFFNTGRKKGKSKETIEEMDKFLVDLGFLDKQAEPAYITVQHILIGFEGSVRGKNITRSKEEAEKLAKEVLAKAKEGGDFLALVKEHTDDAAPGIYQMANFGEKGDMSGIRAEDMIFERGKMVPAFGNTGFPLDVGGVGLAEFDSATSPYGWHIVKRIK